MNFFGSTGPDPSKNLPLSNFDLNITLARNNSEKIHIMLLVQPSMFTEIKFDWMQLD